MNEPSETARWRDDFSDAVAPGAVVGSAAPGGPVRRGIDRDGRMSVDHGALRVPYLEEPGWGRAALAYGPFALDDGAVCVVSVLNGRQGSRTHSPRKPFARRPLLENLAVGWFSALHPGDPTAGDARAFVVRAADEQNAHLLAHVDDGVTTVFERLADVPTTYVVLVRGGRTEYYAGSIAGVEGLPALPYVRPLAVADARRGAWFAGLHQSVLGEVSYRVDTRVDLVAVETGPVIFPPPVIDLDGTAGFDASWTVETGGFAGSARGLGPVVLPARATREAEGGLGLLALDVVADTTDSALRLTVEIGEDTLECAWSAAGLELRRRYDGRDERVAWSAAAGLRVQHPVRLQVVIDGAQVAALVDGERVVGAPGIDPDPAARARVTLECERPGLRIARVHAFATRVELPAALRPADEWPGPGTRTVVREGFDGPAGELAGEWDRVLGVGEIARTGAGTAHVVADRDAPCPGRTCYVRPWGDPGHADVEVTITPPGTGRAEGHRSRAGIVLWEDADNHVIVNVWLDDGYPGASISMFARLCGRERPLDHDAAWTNVGARVRHGAPSRLRLVTDGAHVVAALDGRTVLARRLSDLRADAERIRVRAVGLASNWEWGDDTGSAFGDFVARARG